MENKLEINKLFKKENIIIGLRTINSFTTDAYVVPSSEPTFIKIDDALESDIVKDELKRKQEDEIFVKVSCIDADLDNVYAYTFEDVFENAKEKD